MKPNTATFSGACGACKWPVISCCNNDDFDSKLPEEDQGFDWYVYCSNKSCKNHKATGVFQSSPDWQVPDVG